MINSKELILGSLVTDEFYDSSQTIITVESINDKGINLIIHDDGDLPEISKNWIAPEYYTFDKLFGIPIDKDWLVKMGFWNEFNNFWIDELGMVFYFEDGKLGYTPSYIRNMEDALYIHQVQLIYPFLSGGKNLIIDLNK